MQCYVIQCTLYIFFFYKAKKLSSLNSSLQQHPFPEVNTGVCTKKNHDQRILYPTNSFLKNKNNFFLTWKSSGSTKPVCPC